MKLLCVIVLTALPTLAIGQKSNSADIQPSNRMSTAPGENSDNETQSSVYHAGPWEREIGYSQAVRVGDTIYVSGTTGVNQNGLPSDLEGQLKSSYGAIKKTLAHYGADLSNVVMERIQTTDMDALIKAQDARKRIYGDWAPAATWVEVKRLYETGAKIEIDVEARLDK